MIVNDFKPVVNKHMLVFDYLEKKSLFAYHKLYEDLYVPDVCFDRQSTKYSETKTYSRL